MGKYIPGPDIGKADYLIHHEGATELSGPAEAFEAFDAGLGVVCVVENSTFDAAGFAFSRGELEYFAQPDSEHRPKRWLSMNLERATELSGYKKG